MTDINTRGKLPFTVVSSSENTGYVAELTAAVGQNIDLVNYHRDEYGQLENSPLQGPFTQQHVGGNQHRHIKLNNGNDNQNNRPEAFIISASLNSIKIYGPDIKGTDKPRAILTRGSQAKSPINVSNIQTSGNIAGNFEHNYQVIQSVGRRTSNNLINDNLIASGNLTTQFIRNSEFNVIYTSENYKENVILTSSGDGDPANDRFARHVSVNSDGTIIAAGSYLSDSPADSAGSVVVFKKSSLGWYQDGPPLTSSGDGDPSGDNLGWPISISSDGKVIAAGSYLSDSPAGSAGSVVVFKSSSIGWYQDGSPLTSSGDGSQGGDNLGYDVSINSDGTIIAAGSYLSDSPIGSAGSVIVFKSSSLGWYQDGSPLTSSGDGDPTSDFLGYSVSISSDGKVIAAGSVASDSPSLAAGSVVVFKSSSIGWYQDGSPLTSSGDGSPANDSVGWSVSISSDGKVIAAGSYASDSPDVSAGSVVVFKSSSIGWYQDGSPLTSSGDGDPNSDNLGYDVSINSDGTIIAAGSYLSDSPTGSAGSVVVFKSSSIGWYQYGSPLTSSGNGDIVDNRLGLSVSINYNGGVIVSGAPNVSGSTFPSGSISIFTGEEQTTIKDTRKITYTVPDINNNSKSIFVERFSAPGGKDESSRGALDREGEEFAPNNSLTTRNIKVRQPYYNQLTKHNNKLYVEEAFGGDKALLQKIEISSSFDVSSKEKRPRGFYFREDGSSVYVAGTMSDAIHRYDLPNEWDITSCTFINSSFNTGIDINALTFPPDGTKVFILGFQNGTNFGPYIHRHDLTIPWDLTTMPVIYSANMSIVSPFNANATGICFSPDGKKMFISGRTGGLMSYILEYSLVIPWLTTLANATIVNTINMNPYLSGDYTISGISFYNSGKNLIVCSITQNKVISFKLNNSYDLSNLVINKELGFSDNPNGLYDVYVNLENNKLFTLSHAAGSGPPARIKEYTIAETLSQHKVNRNTLNGISEKNATATYQQMLFTSLLAAEEGNNLTLTINFSAGSDSITVIDQYSVSINFSYDDPTNGAAIAELINNSANWPDNNQLISVDIGSQGLVHDFGTLTFSGGADVLKNNRYDNFWVQHAIPATDLRYKWIADSVSSSQQTIEYQSYNSPYGTGSLYNSNAAFSDIEFEQKGPYGDHLGISGAIDKDEVWVSTHTNTMYRDKKYLTEFDIDFSSISSDISKRDFTVSFWVKVKSDLPDPGPFRLFEYSGSLGSNYLTLYKDTETALGEWAVENSIIPSSYTLETKNLPLNSFDDKWHFMTLVSDKSTLQATINGTTSQLINSTYTKVYLDGALISEKKQKFVDFDVSKIKFTDSYGMFCLDEIIFYVKALTEQEILEIYKISKTDYGNRPKKFFEHNLENITDLNQIDVYSSRIDEKKQILFDELRNRNAVISSVSVLPISTKLISYSTYFDGPYQGASWKSIRKNEHIITRKLNTEDTNIISVVLSDNKTTKRINESPVHMNNKPLKHVVRLKDTYLADTNLEIKHSYLNNLKYFANNDLDLNLGLQKNDTQMYDRLYEFYSNQVPDNQNPIEKLIGYTYSETVFPNPKAAGLKETRQRIDYITDQPGYSIDGYDRQLGTQRVFWRDNQEDRMRTRNTYINSIGEVVESYYDLPFQTPSVAALEEIKETKNISYDPAINESWVDTGFKNSGELNNNLFLSYTKWDDSPEYYTHEKIPVWSVPEYYFFNNISLTVRDNLNVVLRNNSQYSNVNSNDPSCLTATPRYIYEHASIVNQAPLTQTAEHIFKSSSIDLGLSRNTEKISGINPWYDSYEDYYEDIKLISNSKAGIYSTIPEFKISDKIPSLVKEYAGNERKIILDDYIDDVHFSIKNINNNQSSYKDLIEQENSSLLRQDNITLKISGIKKLLPYNGFYPQDYSIKLVNYLKDSYIDSAAVKGGFLLQNSAGSIVSLNYQRSSYDYLQKYLKESSFLEPLYAPGIFYNLIKSGLAVSWPVYTSSLPVNGTFTNMNKSPDFILPFETILDIFNGILVSSSLNNSSNRIMKSREINVEAKAGDYLNDALYVFQGFFELENKSNPLYSLAINNFLAETINLFLKESKLTSFSSKPETEFSEMSDKKTYYMDVILKNNSIIMVDAHSSSINDNYGKMTGMYFGPAVWTGSNAELIDISDDENLHLHKILRDPSYCPYTPPYFYGESIATLSFKPFDGTRRYSLEEIINNLTMSNNNKGLIDDPLKYHSGSLYNSIAMPVSSSVDLFGFREARLRTTDFNNQFDSTITSLRERIGLATGTATNNTGIKEWVISTKMETPVLDFSENSYVVSNNVLSASKADIELKSALPSHTPLTASGFGIGMWSGYGKIPNSNKGIYIQLAETHPDKFITVNSISKTGSLLQVCGFEATTKRKKIGELNNAAEISEAIIIIPYSTNERTPSFLRTGFSSLLVNDTIKIENHNLFKINEQMFEHQKQNILQSKPAVSARSFTVVNPDVPETSISRMIKLMTKYVLPPNFDFLINSDIKPFVMYIAEFTNKLSTEDLANMWQGVMPSIAMKAEHESQILSHPNNIFEFFHGQGLPSDVKFMIFKAKKRAEINYYKMTAKSTDDNLFPKIAVGRRESPYSFNWPYDYCSLVETAKVDVELEYVNVSGSNT